MTTDDPHRTAEHPAMPAARARPDEKSAVTPRARLQPLTLTLRVIMEAGIVGAFAYWGYQTGASTGTKILLAAGAPLLGFGFWGASTSTRQAGWPSPSACSRNWPSPDWPPWRSTPPGSTSPASPWAWSRSSTTPWSTCRADGC